MLIGVSTAKDAPAACAASAARRMSTTFSNGFSMQFSIHTSRDVVAENGRQVLVELVGRDVRAER